MLRDRGVDTVFGCPAATSLDLFKAVADAGIRIIRTTHEQGAGHAADGYARATGRCGVCIVGGGNGVTSMVTPLGTAHMDSVPMVAFSGHVALHHSGDGQFKDVDAVGVTRSCTKWNRLVCDIGELPRTINEAFLVAQSGRPGPVLIDLPMEVQQSKCGQEVEDEPRPQIKRKYGGPPREACRKSVLAAAEVLNASQRPVIYAGRGAVLAGAEDVLRTLAERQHPRHDDAAGPWRIRRRAPAEPAHAGDAR